MLFSKGKIRMYQPKMDQITEFDLGKNRADLESYVVLGFGGSGQDLVKTFDVTYVGPETINGIATAKLKLVPKSEKVRNTYKEISLWIDLDRGISVQQQAFQPERQLPAGEVLLHSGEREDQRRRFQAKDHEQDADDFTERLSC